MSASKVLFSVLILFLLPLQLSAQQAQFDQANVFLIDGEYHQALDIYKSMADEGHNSGALWQNMGIAYSNIDSLGAAKYYFLKAKNFPETREKAEQSLNYVEERFTRRSAVLPKLPWDRFFEFLSENIGLRNLYLTGFLFLNIAAGLLIAAWFYRHRESVFKKSSAAGLLLSVFIFSCAVYLNYTENRFGTGVIIDRQVTVFENPDEDSEPLANAFEGYEVRVDLAAGDGETNSEWKFVRLQNGISGWLSSESILYY